MCLPNALVHVDFPPFATRGRTTGPAQSPSSWTDPRCPIALRPRARRAASRDCSREKMSGAVLRGLFEAPSAVGICSVPRHLGSSKSFNGPMMPRAKARPSFCFSSRTESRWSHVLWQRRISCARRRILRAMFIEVPNPEKRLP